MAVRAMQRRPAGGRVGRNANGVTVRRMSNHDANRNADRAARGGSARYGQAQGARGSGHQESKKLERKETDRGFVPRQGGDQSEHGQRSGKPRSDGESSRG
jgi:hypothetical protein